MEFYQKRFFKNFQAQSVQSKRDPIIVAQGRNLNSNIKGQCHKHMLASSDQLTRASSPLLSVLNIIEPTASLSKNGGLVCWFALGARGQERNQ